MVSVQNECSVQATNNLLRIDTKLAPKIHYTEGKDHVCSVHQCVSSKMSDRQKLFSYICIKYIVGRLMR